MIGKKIKALVDKPDGGNVYKNEIGKIILEDDDGYKTDVYVVNFPDHENYYISRPLDKSKYSFIEEVKLVCYQGDGTEETGELIISNLEKLGGINEEKLIGCYNQFYFINQEGIIDTSLRIPKGYEIVNVSSVNNFYNAKNYEELDTIKGFPKKALEDQSDVLKRKRKKLLNTTLEIIK